MTTPTLPCKLKSFNALYVVCEVHSKESCSPCRHRENSSVVSMSIFKHDWIAYKHLSPLNIFPGEHAEKLLKDKSLTNHTSSPLKTLKACYKAWRLSPSLWPTRLTFICIWSHSPTLFLPSVHSALCQVLTHAFSSLEGSAHVFSLLVLTSPLVSRDALPSSHVFLENHFQGGPLLYLVSQELIDMVVAPYHYF